MEIIGNFGIEPILLAAQIVNFLIIAYLLKRFAYKPILSLLKKRQETVTLGLKQAEEARVLLEQASEKEKAMLQKAQTEAKALLSETRKHNEALMKTAEEQTKKRADDILKEAKEQIERETKEAEKRLQVHTSELAVVILEKAIKELFGTDQQQEVVKKAVKQLKERKIHA